MLVSGFLERTIPAGSRVRRYSVYVPPGFDPAVRWPVILFLHGSGERGDDGRLPATVGLGEVIRSSGLPFPAIVVFPQAPTDGRWLEETANLAMAALEQSLSEFNGDRERIYLTGLSMGGYGAWHLALSNPDRFAALAIVCGGLLTHRVTTAVRRSPLIEGTGDPYRFVANALRLIPAWIFHGKEDPVIPVVEGRRMAEALRESGGNVRYTEYEGVGHPSWERAYREPELWNWLFGQRRASPQKE
jgi:predicted peptidase